MKGSTKRLRNVSAAAAALLGVGLYLAPTADARGLGATASPHLASADAIAVGSVLANGHAVTGAHVQALVWPNAATLAAMPKGATVQTLTLPSVRTDAAGRFAVGLDPASLPAGYRDAKGHTQVELQIANGSRQTAWDFTAVSADRGWTSSSQRLAGASGVETAVFDLGSAAKVTELSGSVAAKFAADSGAGAASRAGAGAASSRIVTTAVAPNSPAVPCVYVAGTTYNNRVEPFMHVYPGRTAPATVTQSYGVDHTLGIAVGGNGSWVGGDAGGSITLSLGASGSRALTGNSTAFNSINFRDYNNVCGWTHRQAISVYSILSRIDSAAEPNFVACTIYTSGTYTKYKGTNITFKNEVNVGPVSVNAQSGWNSSSSVTWVIHGRTGICGSTSSGWVSSPEAEANSS